MVDLDLQAIVCRLTVPPRVGQDLWNRELSVEIVGDLLWGGYLRTIKCACLLLSLVRRFTIYCLDSSPQFCRVCLMVQHLYFCLLCSFVHYSGDIIIHLLQDGRGRVSGSEVISCSHLFEYLCCNRVCVELVSS